MEKKKKQPQINEPSLERWKNFQLSGKKKETGNCIIQHTRIIYLDKCNWNVIQLFNYRSVIKIKSLLMQSCNWNPNLFPSGFSSYCWAALAHHLAFFLKQIAQGFCLLVNGKICQLENKTIFRDNTHCSSQQDFKGIFLTQQSHLTQIQLFLPFPTSRETQQNLTVSPAAICHCKSIQTVLSQFQVRFSYSHAHTEIQEFTISGYLETVINCSI